MAALCRALSADESKLVEQSCGGAEGDVLIATAARFYLAQNQREFTYQYTGAICLFRQKGSLGTFNFRLIDTRSGRSLWDFALIGDIKYQADKPFFHSFVGQTCIVGLSFADELDAASFLERVLKKEKYAPRLSNPNLSFLNTPGSTIGSAIGSKASSPRTSNVTIAPGVASARTSSVEKVIERKDSKSEGGTVGSLFGFGRKNTNKGSKGKLDKSMISAPTNFEHVSHVGYSAQSGFSVENIPLEWKLIFQKAGITDEQLQDKRQRKVVKQFMRDNANLVSGGTSAVPTSTNRRAPPPPPPSSSSRSSRAPPPPPPSRVSVSARPIPASPDHYQPPIKQATAPVTQSTAPVTQYTSERSAPPIPIRGAPPVPVIPTRFAPSVPNIPQRSTPTVSSSGAPPPPPPPAPGPPPPPQPVPSIRHTSAAVSAKLPPVSDTRSNLLDAIRGGAKLKSAAEALQEAPPPPKEGAGDDLADALRNALQNRVKAVAGSDSEEDDSEDDW